MRGRCTTVLWNLWFTTTLWGEEARTWEGSKREEPWSALHPSTGLTKSTSKRLKKMYRDRDPCNTLSAGQNVGEVVSTPLAEALGVDVDSGGDIDDNVSQSRSESRSPTARGILSFIRQCFLAFVNILMYPVGVNCMIFINECDMDLVLSCGNWCNDCVFNDSVSSFDWVSSLRTPWRVD